MFDVLCVLWLAQIERREIARSWVSVGRTVALDRAPIDGEAAADDEWVERLCRELEARGNEVVFGRQVEREASPPTVPELAARIASCHAFLAVIEALAIAPIYPLWVALHGSLFRGKHAVDGEREQCGVALPGPERANEEVILTKQRDLAIILGKIERSRAVRPP